MFVKGARYDKMTQALREVGVDATISQEMRHALNEVIGTGNPIPINAVVDQTDDTVSGRIAI